MIELKHKERGGTKMLETIALFLLTPLAAIGVVTLGEITGRYAYDKEVKRKEKFKQDVLDVINELKEED